MTESEMSRRVQRLEEAQQAFEGTLSKLNTTIALLDQTVQSMNRTQEKRDQFYDRTLLFVVGGFISAGIAWIIKGGLGS